jgi:hypothetical protein
VFPSCRLILRVNRLTFWLKSVSLDLYQVYALSCTFSTGSIVLIWRIFYFKSLPSKVVSRGFRCLIYLDDLLVLLPANKFTTRQVKLLTTILSCFGLTINVKKSRLIPSAQFTHLGLGVDLRTRQFVAPREKVIKLRSAAIHLA